MFLYPNVPIIFNPFNLLHLIFIYFFYNNLRNNIYIYTYVSPTNIISLSNFFLWHPPAAVAYSLVDNIVIPGKTSELNIIFLRVFKRTYIKYRAVFPAMLRLCIGIQHTASIHTISVLNTVFLYRYMSMNGIYEMCLALSLPTYTYILLHIIE